jgi:hypothetical protein
MGVWTATEKSPKERADRVHKGIPSDLSGSARHNAHAVPSDAAATIPSYADPRSESEPP